MTMTNVVRLKIDGVDVEARAGQTVIEAAREAGIYIPYLCWHPILKPYGACRMCVVQVSNAPGLPASCHTPVADGQEVVTNSEAIEEVRRDILALTLAEHPHGCLTCWRVEHCGPSDVCLRNVSVTDRCVVCPQNERCELQDVTYAIKLNEVPLPYKYREIPLETRNPFIDHDMNLCIVCGKCIRACDELEGAKAITFENRGGRTIVATALGGTLADSGCTFCGLCVDVCPVGAITEKDSKWAGAAQDMVTSTCSHCSVGCTLNLNVKKGKLIRSTFDIDGEASHGQECVRGKFGHKWVYSKDRLLQPLVRDGEDLQETSWSDALERIATRLAIYKPGEVLVLASPKNTNEDNYVLQKFARVVLGTNNIDFVDPLCPPAAVEGLQQTFGLAAATNTIWSIRDSSAIVVIDSDLTFDHPVAGLQVKEAVRRGAHAIVLDPRDTEIGLHATEKLVCKPGTEVAVLGGIMRILLDEGLHDARFVAERCGQLDELKDSLARFAVEDVEELSGVPAGQIRQVARVLATHKGVSFLFGAGLYDRGTELAVAVCDLAMLTGNVGRHDGGVFPMRGESNSQGAADMGCQPGSLPGGERVSSAGARLRLREAWGRDLPQGPGISLDQAIGSIESGAIKAVIAIGENQAFADPSGKIAQALSQVDYVVVHEVFGGLLAQTADVVLPATSFAERNGTYTNLERRVQRVRRAIDAPGESRPAWRVIGDLAKCMGANGFDYTDESEIMNEIARTVPAYGGISYARLELGGLQWPCGNLDESGVAVLHMDQFARGLGQFLPIRWPELKPVDGLIAMTAVSREVKGTVELADRNMVELNAADAARVGILDGDRVIVNSGLGVLEGMARVNGRAELGSVLVTMPQISIVTDVFNKPTAGALKPFLQTKSFQVDVRKG